MFRSWRGERARQAPPIKIAVPEDDAACTVKAEVNAVAQLVRFERERVCKLCRLCGVGYECADRACGLGCSLKVRDAGRRLYSLSPTFALR